MVNPKKPWAVEVAQWVTVLDALQRTGAQFPTFLLGGSPLSGTPAPGFQRPLLASMGTALMHRPTHPHIHAHTFLNHILKNEGNLGGCESPPLGHKTNHIKVQ